MEITWGPYQRVAKLSKGVFSMAHMICKTSFFHFDGTNALYENLDKAQARAAQAEASNQRQSKPPSHRLRGGLQNREGFTRSKHPESDTMLFLFGYILAVSRTRQSSMNLHCRWDTLPDIPQLLPRSKHPRKSA